MVSYKNLAVKHLKLEDRVAEVIIDYYKAISLNLDDISYQVPYTLVTVAKELTIKLDWSLIKPYVYTLAEYKDVYLLDQFTRDAYPNQTCKEGYSFTLNDTVVKLDFLTVDYNTSWFLVKR